MKFMAKYNRYEQAIDIYHVNKKHRLYIYDPYIVGLLFRKEVIAWQQQHQQIQHYVFCYCKWHQIYKDLFTLWVKVWKEANTRKREEWNYLLMIMVEKKNWPISDWYIGDFGIRTPLCTVAHEKHVLWRKKKYSFRC